VENRHSNGGLIGGPQGPTDLQVGHGVLSSLLEPSGVVFAVDKHD
jgi:hypothetical protein